MIWHILTVRPACEFQVRDRLHQARVSCLVPVIIRPVSARGATFVRTPLLPSYVFVGDEPELWGALRDRQRPIPARGMLMTDGRPAPIPFAAIAELMTAAELETAAARRPLLPSGYVIGDVVATPLGPGVISRLTKSAIVAVVTILGAAREVRLDRMFVEAVP